jgi:lipopolysaccharide export system permease protein
MRQLILPRYLLREHLGPFCFSFALITLIFILDLVFRHLSRILSKGLPLITVLEFFGLNLAWIVATAVPMAVLTATLMAFGRLAADQEIAALQASGVSLWRLVAPIFIVTSLLAAGLIWFNNNILPEFNHRARLLTTDITRKKPGVKIEPGVWFHEIPNYKLLVQALEDSMMFSQIHDIVLDDHTDPNVQRTISAHAGVLEPRPNEGLLFFTLFDGEIQELNIEKMEEFRRVKFAKHSMSVLASDGMFWQRRETDDRTDREKSVAQMRQEAQKNRARTAWLAQRTNLLVGIDIYPYFGRTFGLVPDSLVHFLLSPRPSTNLRSQQRRLLAQINSLLAEMQDCEQAAQTLMVEIHKKYAIPVACFVFVLIGAPMGVLARRGGLATGVSLSLGFFLLYWAFLISGEDLADRQIVSPFVAMWSANFIIGSFGILVFRRVAFGRLIPMSLSFPKWFGRIFLRKSIESSHRQPDDDSPTIFPIQLSEIGESEPGIPDSVMEDQPYDEGALPASQIELSPPLSSVTDGSAPLHRRGETTAQHSSPISADTDGRASRREAVPPGVTALHSSDAEALAPPQLEFTPVPKILRHLTQRIRADLALFANCNGVPMAHCKNPATELAPQPDLEMIAKLAAGQMAATREIGRSLGEDRDVASIFQEGERRNLFIYEISPDFILIVVIEKTVVIGMVRIQAQEAVANLRKTLNLV